jgi:hypothetical protein
MCRRQRVAEPTNCFDPLLRQNHRPAHRSHYKETALTEGLQEHPNQEIRVRNEFLPLAAIRWQLSAAMTDRQPELERLSRRCDGGIIRRKAAVLALWAPWR